MTDLTWSGTDLDSASSESGVAHESVTNTDHNDASLLKQGYPYNNLYRPSDLIFWYPLHEDSGSTANDVSGNGNDGTVNGFTKGVAGPGGNTAYDGDGSNEYIDTGLSTPPFESLSDATFHMWFKLNNTSRFPMIRQQNSHVLSYNPNGNNRFVWSTWGNNTGNIGPSVTDTGSWHHFIFTVASNQDWTIYLDGTKYSGGYSDGADSSSQNEHVFGFSSGGYPDARGADVAMWNTHFGDADAQELYDTYRTSGSLITSDQTT